MKTAGLRRLIGGSVGAITGALLLAGPAQAAFPGANGDIIFDSNRDTAAGDLYAIPRSGGAVRVTESTGSSDAVYSPDGSRIAFISTEPGGAYQVFLANSDGSERTPLTTGNTAKLEPAFSPDGQQVAFVTNDPDIAENDLEVFAIRVDGTGLRQITENAVSDTSPAWSPDGSRIALVRQSDIWTVAASGGGDVNLTEDSPPGCTSDCYLGPDADPAWHPSGALIAYSHRNTAAGTEGPDIWVMSSAGGGGKTNLTESQTATFVQPAYSPQGDAIAAVGAVDTNRDIWVMNADGGQPAPIESHPAHDINPDWGPPSPLTDSDPPELELAGKKQQKLGKVVKQKASCDEDCALKATGVLTIAAGKKGKSRIVLRAKKAKLKPARAQAAAGATKTLKLKVPKRARKLAERALDDGRKVKAKLVVKATDSAGNTDKAKRTLKLKG